MTPEARDSSIPSVRIFLKSGMGRRPCIAVAFSGGLSCPSGVPAGSLCVRRGARVLFVNRTLGDVDLEFSEGEWFREGTTLHGRMVRFTAQRTSELYAVGTSSSQEVEIEAASISGQSQAGLCDRSRPSPKIVIVP